MSKKVSVNHHGLAAAAQAGWFVCSERAHLLGLAKSGWRLLMWLYGAKAELQAASIQHTVLYSILGRKYIAQGYKVTHFSSS